ncbi:MAG: hypothetical protein RML38_12015 [Bacteroidia bacterium]|nr:hypothetical protein [Bacteroidia bacterium]
MMTDIPVVIAHFGNKPEYLKCALDAAARWNRTVFLLGDDQNRDLWPYHFNATGINLPKWQEFQRVYVKFSNYPDFYEWAFWFRMFFLEFWMQNEGWRQAFLLDSDSVTFANYTQELQFLWKQGYIAGLVTPKRPDDCLLWHSSPEFSYWTIEAITNFTDFCINAYSSPDYLNLFRQFFQQRLEAGLGGGVCEMTLLNEWSKDKTGIYNFAQVFSSSNSDSVTFDALIQSSGNYVREEDYVTPFGIKKVSFPKGEYITKFGVKVFRFKHGQPYCYNLMLQKDIRFLGIQCAGGYKFLMKRFMSPVWRHLYLWEVGLRKVRHRLYKNIDKYRLRKI